MVASRLVAAPEHRRSAAMNPYTYTAKRYTYPYTTTQDEAGS